MKRFKTVDDLIIGYPEWGEILEKLRSIIHTAQLTEEVKWGMPVYTLDKKILVGLGAFKSYAGIWFFQGGLLKDPHNRLVNAQEGKTKAMRQMRFSSVQEIDEKIILSYLEETIENHRAGKEIKAERKKEVLIPTFLQEALKKNPELSVSFNKLTPGKQREYCEYIETAKREASKQSRLDKILPMILAGKGLNDRYK